MYIDFDPVAIALGPLKIHWYGLAWALAFLFVTHGSEWTSRKLYGSKDSQDLSSVIFIGFIGVFLGGRLGYMFFYGLEMWSNDIFSVFYLHQGGMSFHGGLIGGALGGLLRARQLNYSPIRALDISALWMPGALGLVRLANFVNGELWGRSVSSDHPMGMVFASDPALLPRHPSQLYEAFGEGPLLAVFIFLMFRLFPKQGVATLSAVMGYGVIRFIVEFFREPDAHLSFDLFGWVTRGQILSFPMALAGAFALVWLIRQSGDPLAKIFSSHIPGATSAKQPAKSKTSKTRKKK